MADPVPSLVTSGQSATAITTVNFTAVAAGTLLVLDVVSDDYRVTTGTSRPEANGWTLEQIISTGSNHGSYMWWKIATGAETSVAYQIATAVKSVYVLSAYTNIDPTPADGSGQQFITSSGQSYTTTSLTPTVGRRLVLAHMGYSRSTVLFTGVGTWLNSYAAVGQAVTTATPGLAVGVASLVLDGGTATSTGSTVTPAGNTGARSAIIASFKVATGVTPTRVTKTQTISWAVRKRVTKSSVLTWSASTRVTKTQTVSWAVRKRITKSSNLTWSARTRVTKTQAISWAVRGRVTKSSSVTWSARTRITKTQTVSWAVRRRVTKSLSVTWGDTSRVVKSVAPTWNVRKRIVKTSTASWQVRQRVVKTVAISWDTQASGASAQGYVTSAGSLKVITSHSVIINGVKKLVTSISVIRDGVKKALL